MIKSCKVNFLSTSMIKTGKVRKNKGKGSPASQCSRSTAEDDSDDNSIDKTADYGVILVKGSKNKPLPPSRLQNHHRGFTKKDHKKGLIEDTEEETFVGFLSSALCGACISTSGGADKALAQVEDNDIVHRPEESPRKATNIYIQRFQKMKEAQLEIEQQKRDMSLLTDVSFLTDPSLTDLEVKEQSLGQSVPSKSSFNKPKILPAFRKLHSRAASAIASYDTKRKQRGISDKGKKANDDQHHLQTISVFSPEASSMPPPPPPPMDACGCPRVCPHPNNSHHLTYCHKAPPGKVASSRPTKKKERKSSLRMGKIGKSLIREKSDKRRLV